MPNQSELQQNDLDGRILDELREGKRTEDNLVTELGRLTTGFAHDYNSWTVLAT